MFIISLFKVTIFITGSLFFMEIHEKLRVMRTVKRLSQQELADKLGISLVSYAKIERGESDIQISRLKQIVEKLGIDLDTLFSLNERNVFNIIEHCTSHICSHITNGNIVLSESQCAHELEKAVLIQQSLEKEVELLRKQVSQLEQINQLLKGDKTNV
jgi:DNA-binding XRE family transcriptional regulator